MPQHSQVSDEASMQLVEVLFVALPGVESAGAWSAFLNCILRIVEGEVRRTAAAERRRWETPSES